MITTMGKWNARAHKIVMENALAHKIGMERMMKSCDIGTSFKAEMATEHEVL